MIERKGAMLQKLRRLMPGGIAFSSRPSSNLQAMPSASFVLLSDIITQGEEHHDCRRSMDWEARRLAVLVNLLEKARLQRLEK